MRRRSPRSWSSAERNRSSRTALLRLPARGDARTRGARLLDRFLDGFGLFRDLAELLQVFALSFAMFLCFAVGARHQRVVAAHRRCRGTPGLVMLVVTAIGIMVPAAPGYIGTLNIACVVGTGAVRRGQGLPRARFCWFYFFSQWLPITAVGLYYLHREGLSLKSLGQAHDATA